MKNRIELDVQLLSDYINYNSETGVLTWRKNFFKTKIGKEIGSISTLGYRKVTFKGLTILCHRVAWAIHYGEQPPEVIDHINGNRTDNRMSNLRSVTMGGNARNQRSASKSNKSSKYLGVSKFEGRWRAKIKSHGKYIFIGYFDTEEQARDAYIDKKRMVHDTCTI